MADGFQATEKFTDDDWNETSTEAPPPLPSDIYVGKVVAAEAQMGSKNPTARLTLEFSAVYGGAALKAPRKVTDFVTVTKATMWKVKQYSQAGGNIKNPTDNGSEALNDWCAALTGADIICKIRQDFFLRGDEKVPTNKVDRPLSPEDAQKARGLAPADATAGAADGGTRRRRGS